MRITSSCVTGAGQIHSLHMHKTLYQSLSIIDIPSHSLSLEQYYWDPAPVSVSADRCPHFHSLDSQTRRTCRKLIDHCWNWNRWVSSQSALKVQSNLSLHRVEEPCSPICDEVLGCAHRVKCLEFDQKCVPSTCVTIHILGSILRDYSPRCRRMSSLAYRRHYRLFALSLQPSQVRSVL